MRDFGSAVVLAGGKSSRMGFDKSTMVLQNKKLIESTIKKLDSLFDDIIISVDGLEKKSEFNHDKIVVDKVKGVGPLGGMISALEMAQSDRLFVIPCDMPVIDIKYISFMMKYMDDNEIILSEKNGYFEPFPGFYSKSLIPRIEELINQNRRSIRSIFECSRTKVISESEWKKLGFSEEIFTNLNTTQDVEKYLSYK
ncbi:molybdenum cofactor guanylyltransferase [Acetoanaerobium noterae]|uniref:molybdenum cofactor guanylyltransferase n=1 Tax=Acetoanaerobium noterae TaxID=745369 RepID=UPI0028B0D26A|nr:molybdenum cofactor guanylyltransferase [Acetoanaerobium noterae]